MFETPGIARLRGAGVWSLSVAHALADLVLPGGCAACSAEGGALCRTCRRGLRVSPEALQLLRRILGGDLVAVLGEPASPAGHEVEHLAALALENHVERRLRSLGVLERG